MAGMAGMAGITGMAALPLGNFASPVYTGLEYKSAGHRVGCPVEAARNPRRASKWRKSAVEGCG